MKRSRTMFGAALVAILTFAAGAACSQSTGARQFGAQSLQVGHRLGAARTPLGLDRRRRRRPRRFERLGLRALQHSRAALGYQARAAVRLRRLEPRSDPQVRRLGQAREVVRRRAVRVPAWPPRRSRRQRLGHRQHRQGRQGPSGVQVQPRRQGADAARQGRRRRQRPGRVQRAVGRARRAERRHLRRRRPWRQQQCAHRQVRQDRQVHQDLGPEGLGSRRSRHSPCARHGFARPPVRRRSRQQPHPDLRSGRQAPRFLVAVQPAERHRHRQEGPDLRRRFRVGIGRQGPRRLEARHAHRQRRRRQGDRVHPRSGRERHLDERRRRRRGRCRRATSTAPRSARSA